MDHVLNGGDFSWGGRKGFAKLFAQVVKEGQDAGHIIHIFGARLRHETLAQGKLSVRHQHDRLQKFLQERVHLKREKKFNKLSQV